MKLAICHETAYHYTAPLAYTIQQLRLTPRLESHQQTLHWNITTSGERNAFTDAFGNLGHMLTISTQHDGVKIAVDGVVDVSLLDRGRLPDKDVLSRLVFTSPTRLIECTPTVDDFAHLHLRAGADSAGLIKLAEEICAAVAYRSGATVVTSSAADALALGEGVCQDHAHLFLACCHAHGIPARYVSGYIDSGKSASAESHAWVDVWVDEKDYSGWVSIDVTHAKFSNQSHCRLAVGRDYDSAAPIRGVRRGGGEESLTVDVKVAAFVQTNA
ncbi:transglutaminase family protein [soil metagenome]